MAKHIIDQIYDKLLEVFPINDEQLFCMEFPGRVLNENDYAYDTDSAYATLTKPQPVVEAEFRLTDDLFDVAGLVGGPSGRKMATSYDAALNLLAPKYPEDSAFDEDKSEIRKWLTEQITISIDGQETTGSRMELYELLYQNYLNAKGDWAEEKTEQLNAAMQADDPEEALEAYSRWLAREAPIKDAEQETLFADLVVRGYYHKIRHLLSLLDITTEGGELEAAKEDMRNSSMSSLDESETIYPVNLQPSDWFRSLNTDFKPQDLLLSPDYLRDQLVLKVQQMEDLQLQYAMLESLQTGDADELQDAVDKAYEDYQNAQTALIQNFGNATVQLAEIYFDQQNKKKEAAVKGDFDDLLDSYASGPLTDDQWDQLVELQNEAIEAQQNLTTASKVLSDLQMEQAAASTTDSEQGLLSLQSRMNSLQLEIDDLRSILLSASYDDSDNLAIDDIPIVPDSMPPAGQFMDITLSYSGSTDYATSSLSSGASNTNFSVDVIFGSASGTSSKSWSDFSARHNMQNTDIEIGMRVTKVTIDRGWFNPQIFGMTADMFRVDGSDELVISDGIIDPSVIESIKDYKTPLFAAYPMAFIVAKDVTMKFKFTADFTDEDKETFKSSSSTSGGFLCFGASGSKSTSSTSQSYYHATEDQALIMKIPGPQILGWYLQSVEKDESDTDYTPMPEGFLPEDNLGVSIATTETEVYSEAQSDVEAEAIPTTS